VTALRTALLVAAVLLIAAPPARGEADDPVVARIDGEPIHRSAVDALVAAMPPAYRDQAGSRLRADLLDRLITARLLAAEARRRGLDADPVLQSQAALAVDEILTRALIERAVAEATAEPRVLAAYEALAAEPGFARAEVEARHIMLATRDAALAVIAELDAGADFSTLARERAYSPDTGRYVESLGWLRDDEADIPYVAAALRLAPGDVAREPVESALGWHVIQTMARRTVRPSVDELRPRIAERLRAAAIEGLLAEVRAGERVERLATDGRPAATVTR
jgi:peptidyl-prolyl cis-trans isomerase C